MEQQPIIVNYKWHNRDLAGDLVCELTEFIDNYLLFKKPDCAFTCLYNDLGCYSSPGLLQIAFRYPGATRGGILLKRLSSHRFEIVGVHFNTDVCFDEFAIYDKQLEQDIDRYIGRILDFSKVRLVNNYLEFTY